MPVVAFQNDMPIGFTFMRPGTPVSNILPDDIYFNLIQQPGQNVPGATFVQRVPTPSGAISTNMRYFPQNPGRWGATMQPGMTTLPGGTTGEFGVFPDPEQEEKNQAFSNPLHKVFKIPGFSRLPDLKDNINVIFNPRKPAPPGSELVYIQVPAGSGSYYFCPGVTLTEFMNLKTKEEVAKLCGVPTELLDADVIVSAFSPVRQALKTRLY